MSSSSSSSSGSKKHKERRAPSPPPASDDDDTHRMMDEIERKTGGDMTKTFKLDKKKSTKPQKRHREEEEEENQRSGGDDDAEQRKVASPQKKKHKVNDSESKPQAESSRMSAAEMEELVALREMRDQHMKNQQKERERERIKNEEKAIKVKDEPQTKKEEPATTTTIKSEPPAKQQPEEDLSGLDYGEKNRRIADKWEENYNKGTIGLVSDPNLALLISNRLGKTYSNFFDQNGIDQLLKVSADEKNEYINATYIVPQRSINGHSTYKYTVILPFMAAAGFLKFGPTIETGVNAGRGKPINGEVPNDDTLGFQFNQTSKSVNPPFCNPKTFQDMASEYWSTIIYPKIISTLFESAWKMKTKGLPLFHKMKIKDIMETIPEADRMKYAFDNLFNKKVSWNDKEKVWECDARVSIFTNPKCEWVATGEKGKKKPVIDQDSIEEYKQRLKELEENDWPFLSNLYKEQFEEKEKDDRGRVTGIKYHIINEIPFYVCRRPEDVEPGKDYPSPLIRVNPSEAVLTKDDVFALECQVRGYQCKMGKAGHTLKPTAIIWLNTKKGLDQYAREKDIKKGNPEFCVPCAGVYVPLSKRPKIAFESESSSSSSSNTTTKNGSYDAFHSR